MVLLKDLIANIKNVKADLFTFQYGSIKGMRDVLFANYDKLNLHSNMVLLKVVE